MRNFHLFIILLFITIPCFAQAGEADLSSVQPTNDSNEFECLKETAPEYDIWDEFGRPECWCYKKQCRGDINGKPFLGKPVTGADLIIFKAAFNKTDADLALVPNGICADLNHTTFLGKRVTGADLIIFKAYFNKADSVVPVCDQLPIITGPYNFWTKP